MHIHIYTYMQSYMYTCMHIYTHGIHAFIHTWYTCIHISMRAFTHRMHAYIHTCMHIFVCKSFAIRVSKRYDICCRLLTLIVDTCSLSEVRRTCRGSEGKSVIVRCRSISFLFALSPNLLHAKPQAFIAALFSFAFDFVKCRYITPPFDIRSIIILLVSPGIFFISGNRKGERHLKSAIVRAV